MNKETIALTEEQYIKIIKTIRSGFVCKNGHKVKPNDRIATILVLEANIGIRICDVLQLKLSSIIKDGERYRLNIVEKKSKLKRNFTVPLEISTSIFKTMLWKTISILLQNCLIYRRGQLISI